MKAPKEKAEELFNKFYDATDEHWNRVHVSKQCALIAVDGMLEGVTFLKNREYMTLYYNEVKTEIKKL